MTAAAKGGGRHMKEQSQGHLLLCTAQCSILRRIYGRLYRTFCESPKSGVVNDVTHQSEHQQCQGETSDGEREREDNYYPGQCGNYPCPVISEIHGIPSKPPFRGPFKTNFFKGSIAATQLACFFFYYYKGGWLAGWLLLRNRSPENYLVFGGGVGPYLYNTKELYTSQIRVCSSSSSSFINNQRQEEEEEL